MSISLRPNTEAAVWEAPGLQVKEIYQLILGCIPEGGDLKEFSLGEERLTGTTFLGLLQPSWPDTCGNQF